MNFYKIKASGVSRFIPCEDVVSIRAMRDNLGGKLVVDEKGNPRVYTEVDIERLMGDNARNKVDVKSLFDGGNSVIG